MSVNMMAASWRDDDIENGLNKDSKMKTEFRVYQADICVDDGHINQTFMQNAADHLLLRNIVIIWQKCI